MEIAPTAQRSSSVAAVSIPPVVIDRECGQSEDVRYKGTNGCLALPARPALPGIRSRPRSVVVFAQNGLATSTVAIRSASPPARIVNTPLKALIPPHVQ